MREVWVSKPLEAVCTIVGGGTPSKAVKEFYSGSIPWATVRDMNTELLSNTDFRITEEAVAKSATNIIPQNNVVIATRVGLGKVCILAQDTAINQDLKGVLPKKFEELDVRYLFRWLQSAASKIEEAGNGMTVKGVSLPFVKSLKIPLPPLPEQQRIVAILDKAFAGIEAAAANAQKNLANARELFESILAEAITGRLTLEWRRVHSNTKCASSYLKKRLSQRRIQFKGRGRYTEPAPPVTDNSVDIPDSWTLASPAQVSIYIVDCPHSTPKWTKKGVVCLRTTNFKPGFLDLESVQFVSEEAYKERIKRLAPMPSDVLYSREGGILGIACIIPSGLKACLGQRMMQFRIDPSIALPQYFAAVLNSKLILSVVKRLTGGAASPHLNIRDIKTFPIPLPPIAEQYSIVEKLDSLSTETQRLETIYQKKLTTLAELKQSILQKAFSGELTAQLAGQEALA